MNLSIIRKFRNKHFLSLMSNGTMAIMSVITYAILYRVLPETEIGNWIFFQTMFALFDAIRTGFLQTAFIKFYSGAGEHRKLTIAGSTWWIAIIITGVLSLLTLPMLFFVSLISDEGVLFFIKWYGITFLLTCPFNVILWILQGEQRFDRILWLRMINQGSFIICIVVLYAMKLLDLDHIIYSFLACSLLTGVIPIIAGWSMISRIKNKTSATVREMVRFGRFSMGTYLCSTIFKYSDSIIIKFMLGPAALAVYNLAQRLLEVIEIPIRSVLATAMPAMSALFNRGQVKELGDSMRKFSGSLTIILVPVIITLLLSADLIVSIIGGAKYAQTEAANVFRMFMVSAILFPLDRFFGITLDIIHRPQLNLLKIFLSLVINVVADIIALRLFGNVYGIAAASIITLLFGVTFGYFSLIRYLPFRLNGILQIGFTESKNFLSGILKHKPVL